MYSHILLRNVYEIAQSDTSLVFTIKVSDTICIKNYPEKNHNKIDVYHDMNYTHVSL